MAVASESRWVGRPRELISGIDTLVLSYRGVAHSDFLASLTEAKQVAGQLSARVPFNIGEEEFLVGAGSLSRHAFRLQHARGVLGIAAGEKLPVVRFQPHAEVLHSLGPRGVAEWVRGVVGEQVEITGEIVSRVDLHADFQDLHLTREDEDNFVTRAKRVGTYRDSGVFTGFNFGKRTSRSISARIYDKTDEIATKGGTYWYELWGDEFVPGEVVWRVEFELHRGFLHEFSITTLDELLERVGGLWNHATTSWLSIRHPTEDQTKSRWPLDPRWQAVIEATLGSRIISLERAATLQTRDTAERELPFLLGGIVRWGAIMGTTTLEETLATLPVSLRRQLFKSGCDFKRLQNAKRIAMGLVS